MSKGLVRTTLAVPASLLARVDRAVKEGQARSRNSFVTAAVEHELELQARRSIDEAFAAMAEDSKYQAEALALSQEFAASDAEASRGRGGSK